MTLPAPYHFVPVAPDLNISGTTVLQDVLDLDQTCTGELHCVLETLTPLLPANDQYDFQVAKPELQAQIVAAASHRLKCSIDECPPIDPDKKILEPLSLVDPDHPDAPDPILIGGAALKGVLSSAIASLLSSPMDRVAERTFSYRPNVQLTGAADEAALTTHAGIVAERKADGSLRVWAFRPNDLRYLRPEDAPSYLAELGGESSVSSTLRRVRSASSPADVREELVNLKTTGDFYLLKYRTGLDGQGIVQALFNDKCDPKDRTRRYDWVGVPENLLANNPRDTIPKELIEGWKETLRHLADSPCGHLRLHPLVKTAETRRQVKAAIYELLEEGFRPGDVIFFEKSGNRPITLGHHFRYRWRYRDSVRYHEPRPSSQSVIGTLLRDVLCPPPLATPGHVPESLSGARLLFGYVRSADTELRESDLYGSHEPADFAQMAGRIAINTAVEEIAERTMEQRFVNSQDDYLVFLRPLSSPKPSAVEHYLEQGRDRLTQRHSSGHRDNGTLCTFGDDAIDLSAGQLRGRKHYLHSPRSATEYHHFDLCQRDAPQGSRYPEDQEMLLSNQAAVARFVSRERTRFHFTIRFVNLRKWELGALLFALDPSRSDLDTIITWLELPTTRLKPFDKWLKQAERRTQRNPEHPLLAHKLGHGRPLGLGSVQISIERMRRLSINKEALPDLTDANDRQSLIDEFAFYIANYLQNEQRRDDWVEKILLPWLEVHRFVGRRPYEYPRPSYNEPIHAYHTEVRQEHAKGRKLRSTAVPQPRGLKSLDDLAGMEG